MSSSQQTDKHLVVNGCFLLFSRIVINSSLEVFHSERSSESHQNVLIVSLSGRSGSYNVTEGWRQTKTSGSLSAEILWSHEFVGQRGVRLLLTEDNSIYMRGCRHVISHTHTHTQWLKGFIWRLAWQIGQWQMNTGMLFQAFGHSA